MNIFVASILALVLHVEAGQRVQAAVDSARTVYEARGEKTTILIESGTYQEELTIDVPGLKMKCADKKDRAKITWYYGHGYQYKSMGKTNYGGSRSRLWNASVLVDAPDFYAENIIFENSFNLYISEKEAADSLYILPEYTAHEMPVRPKEAGSKEVQKKKYRERASAISFTEKATNAHLKNCCAVGRQDVLYGENGASIYWEGGELKGGVDFIFGGMKMAVDRATIVANINGEKGDKCYIAAGRSGSETQPARGMLFYKCHIRLATEEELELSHVKVTATHTKNGVTTTDLDINQTKPRKEQVWLSRPWRWWGETVWAYTTWDEGVLNPEAWSTGLVQKKEGFDPENACPNSYEYRSQDGSAGRPKWVTVLQQPILPDGTKLNPKKWLTKH